MTLHSHDPGRPPLACRPPRPRPQAPSVRQLHCGVLWCVPYGLPSPIGRAGQGGPSALVRLWISPCPRRGCCALVRLWVSQRPRRGCYALVRPWDSPRPRRGCCAAPLQVLPHARSPSLGRRLNKRVGCGSRVRALPQLLANTPIGIQNRPS
eukprot:353675-Chlamydomonas_euryale.AAC.1